MRDLFARGHYLIQSDDRDPNDTAYGWYSRGV